MTYEVELTAVDLVPSYLGMEENGTAASRHVVSVFCAWSTGCCSYVSLPRSSTQDQDTQAMSDSDESSDSLQPPPPPVSKPPSSRPVRASMPPPQKQDSPKAGEALPNTISGARPTRHARSSLPAPPQRAAATTTGRKISSEVVSSDAKFGHRLRSTEEGGRGTPRALPKTSTLMATTASQRAKAVTKPTSKPTAARSTPPLRPKTNVPGGTASQLTATPKGAAITPTSKRQYAPKAPGKRI